MDNVKTSWWASHRPSKRRLVQLYCALLYNAHVRGFVEGVAYRVVRSTSVDFKPENCEFPDGEIVSVKGDEAIWEGSKPDDPATGAKFYRVEVVRTAAE